MPAFTRVSISFPGIARYLRESTDLRAALLAHAEVGAAHARTIAPVGPERDPHRGDFKASIKAGTHTGPGGFIEARITAEPVWVEFGRKHRERYEGSHTLRRTGQWLNAPKRSV